MEKYEMLKSKMPDKETIYELAELFKIFGDSTRAEILSALEVSSLKVSEIAELIGVSVSATSHQLRILRNSKLVKAIKTGKDVTYSLDDEHVSEIIECGLSHIREK